MAEDNIKDTSDVFDCLIRQRRMPNWENPAYESFHRVSQLLLTSSVSSLAREICSGKNVSN
jgi:hypothetical protein